MGQELTIKNVNKSFEVNGEKINVLNDINLDIKEGSWNDFSGTPAVSMDEY